MRLPVWLLHNPLTWISGLFQWIGRYYAYLFEIFTAGILLLGFLIGVPSLLLNHPSLFWGMFIVLLLFLAFIPAALYLARDGLTHIMIWEADPNRQSLLALQRERARLAFLQVKAQEENERLYYWKHRRFADPSEPLTISKYAGPMSFYYVTLSNYLSLPPDEPAIEPGSSEGQALPSPQREASGAPSSQDTNERAQVHSPYAVLLLGGVRFRLRGAEVKEVPVKSVRVRETLAYLAVSDREKGCNRDEIVCAIHEEHAIGDEETADIGEVDYLKKGREAFAYDVSVLRDLLKEACQQVQLPYVNPVKADRGNGAFHRLTEVYVVEDITRFEHLVEDLAARKQHTGQMTDLEAFRKEYVTVLSLYGDGFLGLQTRKLARRWVRAHATCYQEMYHGLLWDLAEYEHAVGQSQQGEERKTSFRQAADLYERCAFLTAPSADDVEQGNYSSLSEQALRQCLRLYGLLGNHTNVHHTYHRYLKLLRRKSKEWLPDPQTDQAYEEAKRSSREA